jgi:hypothetical protein
LVARFALEAGDFVVGRAESCEVIIDLDGMAPEQLRLRVGDRIVVENLAYGEGTFIGAERLTTPREWDPSHAITFPACGGTLMIGDDSDSAARESEAGGEEMQNWVALMAEKAASEDRQAALEAELAAARAQVLAECTRKEQAESAAAQAQQALEMERKRLEARLAEAAEQGRIGGEAVRVARLAWDAERERLEARLAEAAAATQSAAEQARVAADAEREAALAAVREECAAQSEEQASAAAARERATSESSQLQARVAELDAALRDSAAETAREREAMAEVRHELDAERKAFEVQLSAVHERYEEDIRELQEKLEQAGAEGADPSAEGGSGKAGSRDLLSIANKVLFNKLKDTTNLERENDTLRKELKQRELALVTAWSDRQRAEERAAQVAKEAARNAGALAPAESPRSRRISALALGLAFAMLLTIAGLGLWVAHLAARAYRAEAVVAVVKPTAPQLHEQAKELIASGEFKEAVSRLACAIALEPAVAEYRFTEGDAHESLLQLEAARDAYDRGLQLDPTNAVARRNLELCRRLLATRRGAASAESMYALHGVMMDQKRLPEALQMAHRLGADRPLLHRTLSAILEEARLPARLELNGDGSFDLDLSGPGRPDLSVLTHIPLRSLKLARSDVVDLTPLKGLALKKLDLAETRVHDISALQGMPLTTLDLSKTDVSNLFPLEKMPLLELSLDDTPVSDISVLQGMRLNSLHMAGTRIRNLAALAGSPLRTLDLSGTHVADLTPLRHLPIERLQLNNTNVVDLAPLAGARLVSLSLTGTEVDDLRPLQKLPLKELALGRCEKLRDVRPLAACVSLERLMLPQQVTDIEALRKLPGLRFLSYEKANALVDNEQSAADFWAARKAK